MSKKFYIAVRIGDKERIISIESPEFAKCVKRYALNTLSLTECELELFRGTLAVTGLLEHFVPSKLSGVVFIKYGNPPKCDYGYD